MKHPAVSPDQSGPRKSSKRRQFFVPILIAVVAVALIVFSLTQGSDDSPAPNAEGTSDQTDTSADFGSGSDASDEGAEPEDEGASQEDPSDAERLEMYAELATLAKHEPEDPLSMGDADAPLTMLIYSDFRCPFCGQWERTTLPVLIDEYVESGQMRLEWRDMPVLGEASVDAAHAARAAAQQDQFWEFTSALYAEDFQSGADDSDYAPEPMADLAAELGMDREQFLTDLKEAEFASDVEAHRNEAWSLGFTGTPAFLIEGVPVIGAQPYETFEGAIQYRINQLEDQE